MGLELILMDVKGIFRDIRPHDLGPAFFWGLWLSVVLASLRGVDRRDELAQVTYMGFVAAFGVLFVMVFPIGRNSNYTPQGQIVLFSVLLLVPSVRWIMRRRETELDRKMVEASTTVKSKKGK